MTIDEFKKQLEPMAGEFQLEVSTVYPGSTCVRHRTVSFADLMNSADPGELPSELELVDIKFTCCPIEVLYYPPFGDSNRYELPAVIGRDLGLTGDDVARVMHSADGNEKGFQFDHELRRWMEEVLCGEVT